MPIRIHAVGRDGIERVFDGDLKRDGPRWIYRIPCATKLDWFEAVFLEVGGGWIQVAMLKNNCGKEHSAMGIPEALFARVVADSGLSLRSSQTDDEHGYRTPSATKVWKRLEARGLAREDKAADRYIYQGDGRSP
ncbi:hypothetical protein [Anaeromyxobacter sp. SG17]|uniref:hypothetical protein n=1 Tax=Anaeromyxobacter sp. SG17 TaxID=2925405 RepID=UPI001F5A2EA3|nr:hypothetical protein [Anaeromyxobacter sp. SG17]